jgi:peptide/nickel transport system permease protein
MGRDIFSMVLYGAQISLKIGIVVVSISLLVGIILGTVSGYYGGRVDEVIMRITDIFLAFPALILAMAVTATLVANDPKADRLMWVMVALAVVGWPGYVRLVRGTVLSVKENAYVEAARAVGASNTRIMMRHILPNCISPIIVTASMNFGTVILAAAGLSFIGLGAEAGSAEWGIMVATGSRYIVHHWWYATFPGLAILIAVLGFNLLGDGLRDILDPKLRR